MLRRLLARFSLLLAVGAVLPVLAAAAPQPRTASRITAPIDANVRVTLHGSVHPLANPQNDRGAVSDSTAMNRMLLVLKRSPNQDKALAQAIKEMERPGSKTYHRWLTPEQIGAVYGPSVQDIAAVTGWLETAGFRVTSVSRASSLPPLSTRKFTPMRGMARRTPPTRRIRRFPGRWRRWWPGLLRSTIFLCSRSLPRRMW